MLTVQTSQTGRDEDWADIDQRFKSKKAAKEWFDQTFVKQAIYDHEQAYDWRVGFLVRTREGKYYRLRHPDHKPVNY